MKIIFNQFLSKTNILDKLLISLIFLFPLFLSLSIFLADLFASISALIVIALLFFKENKKYFFQIKSEINFFLIFYFIVLISLLFSKSLDKSFLPSFFYFRYFLFILGIYYLFKKHNFFINIFFYSLIFTFSIITIDSFIQFLMGYNLLGYKVGLDPTPYLTSFFDDEKKLGSYLIRLMPLFLSLLYMLNLKKFSPIIILIFGVIIFLSSERTALFLLFVLLLFYFLINKKKIKFLIISSLVIFIVFISNDKLRYKYLDYTLQQLGFIKTSWNQNYEDKKRFFSKEHEDLALTSLIIFKDNFFKGSGIKTFYEVCNLYKLKEEESKLDYLKFLNRNNKITCSTHPHNTYLQILSEIGIFGFFMIFFLFLRALYENIKIIFKKNFSNLIMSYYLLNVGIIINLFPLIPSGNFFNNWMSLIMFYPLGYLLYMHKEIKRENVK